MDMRLLLLESLALPEWYEFREYSPRFQRRRKCSGRENSFAALQTSAPQYSDQSRCNLASIDRATPRRSSECLDQALPQDGDLRIQPARADLFWSQLRESSLRPREN